MPQRWAKLGLICPGEGHVPWARTHAALPVVDHAGGNETTVYFSARDAEGRSRIGAGRLDLANLAAGFRVDETPAIELGPLGAFDDSGVTSSCLVLHEGRRYQYYTGWSRGVTVPFYLYIGLAVSDDGGRTYRRVSAAPILDRCDVDPYLTASPWVIVEKGLWRMWYISGVSWEPTAAGPKHYYHVKYAESADGLHWRPSGLVCLDFQSADEHAFARPCVLKGADGIYRMWYSYRGDRYRIGYAESADGLAWNRKDHQSGIDVSDAGWDSEMVEYPVVFDVGGKRYMLYNGNGYGRTGFGLAVLAD